jgi:signal transduction histidine kinase/DNA-binding response OmpR family regulator
MNPLPQIRVVFWLAICFSQAAAAGFGPLVSPVRLPASLGQRPVWHVSRLPTGELALGHPGGLTLGFPGGTWRTVLAPHGQTVQVVGASHGRVLVAGSGFAGLLQGMALEVVAEMSAEYYGAEAVPEGWLIAGTDGVWLLSPAGVARNVGRPGPKFTGRASRVCRVGDDTWVSIGGYPPRRWRDGRLDGEPVADEWARLQIVSADCDVLLSSSGVVDWAGQSRLAEGINRALIARGITGLARMDDQLVVTTFSDGISAYAAETGARRWQWKGAGDIYGLAVDGDQILLGTGEGAMAMANPAKVGFWRLQHSVIRDLIPTANGRATVVALSASYDIGDETVEALGEVWPARSGVVLEGSELHWSGATKKLRSRFVTGLAAMPEVTAVVLDNKVTLVPLAGMQQAVELDALTDGVATDGQSFFAATTARGVKVFTPQGQVLRQIGDGRSRVRELRAGRVALLFDDGSIRDAEANLLGRVTAGTPTDAALVRGGLAVLVTRPDRGPVVGVFAGHGWQPMEVPGLVEIGAEKIAASDTHFFAAGPRGVVRVRLPLVASAPPRGEWRWSHPVQGGEVMLADALTEPASVAVAPGDLPPAAVTSFRLRVGAGAWTDLIPGAPVPLTVPAGRTPVVLEAERNGLVAESRFTVHRPRPWWQRLWAVGLYALLTGAAVVGGVRWRTRRLDRLNRELEARVAARTAELRQANAVKEEFLASISHEIRNPLNGVVGICEILAERQVGPREHVLVRTLGGCADQLRSMLDDILEFSQLERATPTLANSDFELASLVDECARVMDPDLKACSLLLPEQPCWLHGDSGKIRQVVCNLVSNALKYGVPPEAGIEVQALPTEAGRVRVRIAVRNTGPTIPAEEIPQLFESFRRGSQTGGVPGSGLGLAVCRRLTRAMGGHLTAASSEGQTEFAFECVLASAQPPVRDTATPAPVSRALAIEDEEYNRMVLGHVLRSLGYSVEWAADAQAALRLAATQPFDLILTDWRLPDMQGGELARRLFEILPAPQPPIVAVTAYATAEKLQEAKAVGMAGFVTKPVTREKLVRAIRGLSSGRQARRSLDAETAAPAESTSPLAALGPLAPSPHQLAADIGEHWRSVAALSSLQDPRTGREAHALRGVLLVAGEQIAAEQLELLERAADAGDWDAVAELRTIVAEEIAASETRLRA